MNDETSKLESDTAKLPPNAGKGRPAGSVNKVTKQLKEMILGALDELNGQDYLVKQAKENPTAFLTLLGKVLPTTLANDAENPINLTPNEQIDSRITQLMKQVQLH